MIQLLLFDDPGRDHLLPFAFTRPLADLRCGILTFREKWEHATGQVSTSLCPHYLRKAFSLAEAGQYLGINARLFPNSELLEAIRQLQPGQQLVADNTLLAVQCSSEFLEGKDQLQISPKFQQIPYAGAFRMLSRNWEIFTLAGEAIEADFKRLTENKSSASLSESNRVVGRNPVFLEPGARVECSVINTTDGPVYIGAGAEVMEGCLIRGPFSLGEQAVLRMGTKIYGPTVIGPGCKAGGEISNSVMMGQSNKAHDGFIGNSVIGEWCNLGAGTNTSNLKNNYSEVKVWSYAERKMVSSERIFCGLMMGDHSKCSINTMFNTGTVVGVAANVFGAGFPPKYIPSFSWGEEVFLIDKVLELARKVKARRGMQLSPAEADILAYLHIWHERTPFDGER